MAKRRNVKSAAKKPRIGIVGYGSQGRALALNLSDSGYPVTVGLRAGSRSRSRARRGGEATVMSIPRLVRESSIIAFAFPDHLHARVFKRSIAPHLRVGQTLWFLHGTSVHFELVQPPRKVDTILVAPHAPGKAVREEYLGERSLAAFYAVHHNRTGRAAQTARALASAIGVTRGKLLKTSFAKEAVGDLFGEQAVLCGGLAMLIKSGFMTLVGRGWNPEHAYLEVAYQLDLIVALIKEHGVRGMLARVSPAAQLGSLSAGPQVVNDSSREAMAETFRRIDSGQFAGELATLDRRGLARLKKQLAGLSDSRLERAARKFKK